MTTRVADALVLSLAPNSRGFGFVLFEAPLAPFDWGVQEVRGEEKNRRIIDFVARTIDRYRPVVLVLEDWLDSACRRSARIIALYQALAELARKKSIRLVRISKARLHQHFRAVVPTTKYEIALAIAKLIPAFSFQVPPVRKIWMSEDPRQGLYDAAALGLAHFAGDPGTKTVSTDTVRAIDWV